MTLGPTISVIVPSHNTRELTLRCLRSLAPLAAWLNDVILVDNGSCDGTADAVRREFPDVTLVEEAESLGFSRAVNRGAELSSADLLLFLNADAEILSDSLRPLTDAFQDDPRLGVAGGALEGPGDESHWMPASEPTLLWLFALASGLPALLSPLRGFLLSRKAHATQTARGEDAPVEPIEVDWVTGAAMAVRRQTWQEAGPFEERFEFYAQDLDLCSGARARGWTVRILPRFRVLHRRGASLSQLAGASSRRDNPELLFRDLVFWAAKRNGPRFSARARRMLVLGTRLRLAGYCLRALSGASLAAGAERTADRAAYRLALAGLLASPSHALA